MGVLLEACAWNTAIRDPFAPDRRMNLMAGRLTIQPAARAVYERNHIQSSHAFFCITFAYFLQGMIYIAKGCKKLGEDSKGCGEVTSQAHEVTCHSSSEGEHDQCQTCRISTSHRLLLLAGLYAFSEFPNPQI